MREKTLIEQNNIRRKINILYMRIDSLLVNTDESNLVAREKIDSMRKEIRNLQEMLNETT